MKLILLGPPGSGKGTVSECLARDFKLKHISPGELLREEVDKKTSIGKEVQKYMATGKLVPDDFVVQLVKLQIKGEKSYILDGFPRSLSQALQISVDTVLVLEVPKAALLERLSKRLVCSCCEAGYHLTYLPPKIRGRCDKCGGKLVRRKDDAPSSIQKRFAIYAKETKPVIAYYQKKRKVTIIDAVGMPEQVYARVKEVVRKMYN